MGEMELTNVFVAVENFSAVFGEEFAVLLFSFA